VHNRYDIVLNFDFISVTTPNQAFTDFNHVVLSKKAAIVAKDPDNDKKRIQVADVVVLPSLNLLVADWGNDSLKVVNSETGHLLSRAQLPGTPCRLCLLSGDRAAVTLNDRRIQLMDVSSDMLNLQGIVLVEGECRGLAFLNDNFVVGFTMPGKLAILDFEGREHKSISGRKDEKTLFEYPDYICVASDKYPPTIYVTDWVTETITRLNENLEVMQTFKFPPKYGPFGLAIAGGEQLLVRGGDSEYSTLWLLDTTSGEFKELVQEKKHLKGVSGYVLACVDYCPRLGHVYCGFRRGKDDENIQVYKIS